MFTRHYGDGYTDRVSTYATETRNEDYDIAISDQWAFSIMGHAVPIPTWLANLDHHIHHKHLGDIAIHYLSILVVLVP